MPAITWISRFSGRFAAQQNCWDDPALLKQLHLENQAALTQVYRRSERSLYRFACKVTGSPAMADEAVQKTFLKLIRQPGGWTPKKGSIDGNLRNVTRQAFRQQFIALEEDYDEPASSRCTGPRRTSVWAKRFLGCQDTIVS